MKLKCVRLAGFKSFVDPVTVDLPGEMCAVVGPNGCGKSNVIDAVRWVLGESSARNLRGESMADVIFNGSLARAPVSRASIELVFDNSAGTLGGQFANRQEIAVKRLITRDGSSDYFLNGSRCRRRDITDLFAGTGLGPRSYAIIGQGTISRLIESRPEELRVFIEEAAGISRYRNRRQETEARIRRSRENLHRLEDVREGLISQLKSLERQAKNAERYRSLQARRRDLEARLAALAWLAQAAVIEQVHTTLAALAHDEEDLARQRQENEIRSTRQVARRQQAVSTLEGAQSDWYRIGAKVEDLTRRADTLRAARQEWATEQQALSGERAELANSRKEIDQERIQLRESIDAGAQGLDEQERELEGLRLHRESAALEAATARSERERVLRLHGEARQAMALQRNTLQHQRQRLQDLDQRRARHQAEVLHLQAESQHEQEDHIDDQWAVLQEEEQRGQAQLQRLQQERDSTEAALEQLEKSVDCQQKELQAIDSEERGLAVLLRGLDQAGRARLAQWASQQGLQLVPLLDHLQVAAEWDLSLGAMLGSALDAMVTPLPLSDLTLESLPPGAVLISAAIDGHQAIDPALREGEDLGELDLEAPPAVHDWLQNAVFTRNWPVGDGELDRLAPGKFFIAADGSRRGRTWISRPVADPAANRLAAARRCRVLQQAREPLQKRLEQDLAERERLRNLLRENRTTETRVRQSLRDAGRQIQSLGQQRAARQARIDQLGRRQTRLKEELASVEQERLDLQAETVLVEGTLETACRDHEQAEAQVAHTATEAEALARQLVQAQAALDSATRMLQQARLAQQTASNRLEVLEARAQDCERRARTLEERLQSLVQRLSDSDAELASLAEAGSEAAARQFEAGAALESARRELAEVEQISGADSQQRSALEQALDQLREKQEKNRLALREAELLQRTEVQRLEEIGETLESAQQRVQPGEPTALMQTELEKTREQVRRLGPINLAAIDEHRELVEKNEWMGRQVEDLEEALATLEKAIARIDRETRARFRETFDRVNGFLGDLFPRVFGGGSARLELAGEDLLDAGVTLMARPPGKKNSTIHLLSGGEKALTAIALVFAIFQLNPAPFCMLDEVDAPLDDANVGRFIQLVREMSTRVQFIFITHNKVAMEQADHLLGVTMAEPGVSRLVTVDVEAAVALSEAG